MTYIVTGHYCPTDANPEKDARVEITTEECDTLEEAEALLLWYPGGKIHRLYNWPWLPWKVEQITS